MGIIFNLLCFFETPRIGPCLEDEVAKAGDTGPVFLFFLWSDGADNSGVGDCATRWYL